MLQETVFSLLTEREVLLEGGGLLIATKVFGKVPT
jgi:hypothetical protein